MAPSCSILIPNHNSYLAIELCIESIRKYTSYPGLKIIVCDQSSTNNHDREYLRQANAKGWIELIEENRAEDYYSERAKKRAGHPAGYWHGVALNILVNDCCDTDLAVIMDCDAYVKEPGWLEEPIGCLVDEIIAVVNTVPVRLQKTGGYVLPVYDFSFGLLNMRAYRDGMQVDWRPDIYDRRKEPYLSFLADYYPPEKTEAWAWVNHHKFNRDLVATDPGSKLWMKVAFENPKGYSVINVPYSTWIKHGHFQHISVDYRPHPIHTKAAMAKSLKSDKRFAMIREELQKIRT